MLYETNKGFEIRPANNGDIVSIKKIVFRVLKEYGLTPEETGKDNDLNDIEKNYFDNGGFFGVIVDSNKNKIVGTFGLFSINKNVCELRKMYLLKEVRRRGLGMLMVNKSIDVAKEKNYKKIVLETIHPLKEAISLYKKYGFTEIIPVAINERVDQAFELNLINYQTE